MKNRIIIGSLAYVALLLASYLIKVDPKPSTIAPLVQELVEIAPAQKEGRSISMQRCIDEVKKAPGDLDFVEKHGWKVYCVDSGNINFDEHFDLGVLGYADMEPNVIYLDSKLATSDVIAHEAAHALEQIAFTANNHLMFSTLVDGWLLPKDEDYFNRPTEMFAESRMGCLGYPRDDSFGKIDCTIIDQMISASSYAQEIQSMVKKAQ